MCRRMPRVLPGVLPRFWRVRPSRRGGSLVRELVLGQFCLNEFVQEGRQILRCELFLPSRTPFPESLRQFLLYRFRDGIERLKRFGPFNHRYDRRWIGAGRTLDCGQRQELRLRWFQRFEVELQQPRFVLPDENAEEYLAVLWLQTIFSSQSLEGGNDKPERRRSVYLVKAAGNAEAHSPGRIRLQRPQSSEEIALFDGTELGPGFQGAVNRDKPWKISQEFERTRKRLSS